jgi:hypothetical protein
MASHIFGAELSMIFKQSSKENIFSANVSQWTGRLSEE